MGLVHTGGDFGRGLLRVARHAQGLAFGELRLEARERDAACAHPRGTREALGRGGDVVEVEAHVQGLRTPGAGPPDLGHAGCRVGGLELAEFRVRVVPGFLDRPPTDVALFEVCVLLEFIRAPTLEMRNAREGAVAIGAGFLAEQERREAALFFPVALAFGVVGADDLARLQGCRGRQVQVDLKGGGEKNTTRKKRIDHGLVFFSMSCGLQSVTVRGGVRYSRVASLSSSSLSVT